MRVIWFIFGSIALALGVVGIILPLLPTVPFLLLAAFCFAKSSDAAHKWLIEHHLFGPPIVDWQENGAIRLPAKKLATLCIAAAFGVSLLLKIAVWALALQACVLACVLTFIWTRPNS